jgi:hypothetical protein
MPNRLRRANQAVLQTGAPAVEPVAPARAARAKPAKVKAKAVPAKKTAKRRSR